MPEKKLNWLKSKLAAILDAGEIDAGTIIEYRKFINPPKQAPHPVYAHGNTPYSDDKSQIVASADVSGFLSLNLDLAIENDFSVDRHNSASSTPMEEVIEEVRGANNVAEIETAFQKLE